MRGAANFDERGFGSFHIHERNLFVPDFPFRTKARLGQLSAHTNSLVDLDLRCASTHSITLNELHFDIRMEFGV